MWRCLPREYFECLFLFACISTLCMESSLWAQDRTASSSQGKKPGEERAFSEMKFCWCPPGEFTMGSPKSEPGRQSSERRIDVKHTRGFWMGKYEVTQEEWQRVMNSNPSSYRGKNLPVEQVSWPDANEFCDNLNKLARTAGELPKGWEYRLPTEAQWEYACRAGSTTPYSFGNDPKQLGDYAWYRENSGMKTHPIGKKKPNNWGLHDMHGNVFEWCMDSFQEFPPGGDDPVVLKEAGVRIFRGSSYGAIPRFCRTAVRSRFTPDSRAPYLGIRVVLVQVPASK